jgi:hypothetical protein
MNQDAYHAIAKSLVAHVPGPFERIEAQFRVHDTMFQSQYIAVRGDGKLAGFAVRGAESETLKQAVKQLRETLPHDDTPAFTRADFRLDRSGKFQFDVFYERQLLDRLAAVLRRDWPEGVARLRLVARFVPGEEQGWLLEYYDVSNGHIRALPRPRASVELDTPRWLVADLAQSVKTPAWKVFEIELGRDDGYDVKLDDAVYTPA